MNLRLAVTCVMLSAGAACGDGPMPAAAAIQERTVEVRLEPSTLSFDALGDTIRMRVLRLTSFGRLIEEPFAEWTTTGDSVATVGEDGVVTSVANGVVSVRATVDGFVAEAAVVVEQEPDTVIVMPARTSLVRGNVIRLTARVLDRLGNVMPDSTPIEWSSLSPHVVNIAGPGIVIGVLEDTARVNARAGEAEGSAVVGVVPQEWPNEPEGFRVLTDQPWRALGSNRWSHQNRHTYSHIVTDSTAPHSGSSVLEHVYPEGYTGDGTEPAVDWINADGASDVYMGFWFKASEGWHGHEESGVNKIAFFWPSDHTRPFIVGMRGTGDGPFHLQVVPMNHTAAFQREDAGISGWLSQNVNQLEMIPGQWHRIEVRVDLDTGSINWWQDGVHLGSYTGLALDASTFGQLEIAPTWGGRGTIPKRQDDYFRFDHFRISTRGN